MKDKKEIFKYLDDLEKVEPILKGWGDSIRLDKRIAKECERLSNYLNGTATSRMIKESKESQEQQQY